MLNEWPAAPPSNAPICPFALQKVVHEKWLVAFSTPLVAFSTPLVAFPSPLVAFSTPLVAFPSPLVAFWNLPKKLQGASKSYKGGRGVPVLVFCGQTHPAWPPKSYKWFQKATTGFKKLQAVTKKLQVVTEKLQVVTKNDEKATSRHAKATSGNERCPNPTPPGAWLARTIESVPAGVARERPQEATKSYRQKRH